MSWVRKRKRNNGLWGYVLVQEGLGEYLHGQRSLDLRRCPRGISTYNATNATAQGVQNADEELVALLRSKTRWKSQNGKPVYILLAGPK